ncbi:NAD(P)-dependent glycerol-3-phosphate dehydrogenase [Pseudooceanicola sp. CBS1P-1]|uniref:Glycerol-3-phosphate dehydrogenase [NAD(P)+] n=1 Tax=Pseudooceanicola albus TaxID=2692189 RepID=A0A6L7G8X3_9RHOB|nr:MULTISPECIES: NAD(P)H-dependent glycerol-3-phosphate dehydrogenase [Pseudooceanicola]MBT9385785.1 NAD(P)-dependent glycerol-3-phosphate dehydrogenase [Pseudooceanicola endophyticus]MXN20017.1 NAD(P)H-dependent glycerol-3-phosphate dehydrogenase [Pseudooceanicola albus]
MIAILGAGAFGSALAISIARGGTPVWLWGRSPETMAQMQADRLCPRLPEVALPPQITCASDMALLPGAGPVLLATPMQTLRSLLETHADRLRGRQLVLTCKGIELSTGLRASEVLAQVLPDALPAVLTGPSFAADIARGLPTALTLACADPVLAKTLQAQLSTPNLRLYRSPDVTGAELGGALKNVIAIACGAAIGAGLGDSARAALMTRGYAEMQRLATRLGARPETLAGLSGFGDLTLTCTSSLSRNYRFGLSIGRAEAFDPSVTVEGAATARATDALAASLGLDMPITRVVTGLVEARLDVSEAMHELLNRPLKEERP